MAEFVGIERDGAVGIVTIDRPPVNALSAQVIAELEEAFDELGADEGVRVVVLRGAGERAFVAGADISEFPDLGEEVAEEGSARGIQKLADRIETFHKPVLVAIHGYCLGGGLETALACDIRIAAEDAQLGQPEIKLGLLPGGGGTQRLPRVVGPGRAALMNMGGDPISGSRPTTGGWSSASSRARACWRPHSRSPARSPSARRTRSRWRRSSRARRATCRSPKGSGGRRRRSPAASRARTGARASRPSWRSAQPELDRPVKAVVLEELGGPERLELQRGAGARGAGHPRARRGDQLRGHPDPSRRRTRSRRRCRPCSGRRWPASSTGSA